MDRHCSCCNWCLSAAYQEMLLFVIGCGEYSFWLARSGQWTLKGIGWSTGESRFHYVLGDERYNSLYVGVLLDENGNPFFGTTFGKVRLKLQK